MPLDKYTPEFHKLLETTFGPKWAHRTLVLAWLTFWVVCLSFIGGAVVIVAKFLYRYVSALQNIPLPQLGNAALSFAIAVAVVGVAGAWFFRAFRRTRNAVVSVFTTRLNELGESVNALQRATDDRFSELLRVYSGTTDRVRYLEEAAASVESVNSALDDVNQRVPVGKPPDDVTPDGYTKWALMKMLERPQAYRVGQPLAIHNATYGVDGGPNTDVTNILRRAIKDNRISLKVNNKTMGRDPANGIPKQLRVRYSYGDQTRDVMLDENEQLRIPE